MGALGDYLKGCSEVKGVGVPETSFYPALKSLFDSVGEQMKPKIIALPHPKAVDGCLPDFGLCTPNQVSKAGQPGFQFDDRMTPERGVVEVKGLAQNLDELIKDTQVLKYLRTFRQVLATNLREFAIVQIVDDTPKVIETYQIATSENEFWRLVSDSKRTERLHGKPLVEFLKRALYSTAPIETARDLAFFLASYAREARHRIDVTEDLLALTALKQDLEAALGIQFGSEQGDEFFRSMYVQSLFYGVFSGWVLWHEENPNRKDRFNWRTTHTYLEVPIVEALFRHSTGNTVLRATGIDAIMDTVEDTLARVKPEVFFASFEKGTAVQYFYEPFLASFDPKLRDDLGVWYTPPEIVRYMVERVDRVLKEELGEPKGLASDNVIVLDPCCGTGAYLVECLRHIYRHYEDQGEALTCGDRLRHAATERLFGFELLLAPFVVSHLQVGMFLKQKGGKTDHHDRVAIYLTNALTGWDREKYPPQASSYELNIERTMADKVKAEKPIIVVIGNPPYNGYAGISKMNEEAELVERYDSGKRRGQGLNDLYVRFYAMADRRIEKTGRGVVCFISNYSWLEGLSFSFMRQKYLEQFSKIWIDNLHGDRIISEYAPDGRTSETIFAITGQSIGIKVGTAIATLVRREEHQGSTQKSTLLYRDVDDARAADRRRSLVASTKTDNFDGHYSALEPNDGLGYPFKPRTVGDEYLTWPLLPELMPTSYPGVKTSRDDLLVDIDLDRLAKRMACYFDSVLSDYDMRKISPVSLRITDRFNGPEVRKYLCARGIDPKGYCKYAYRPFDTRFMYYEKETKLLDEKRADLKRLVSEGNRFLSAAQDNRKGFSAPSITSSLASLHIIERSANLYPIKHLVSKHETRSLFDAQEASDGSFTDLCWNLTAVGASYLNTSGVPSDDSLFYHIVAILHSPGYVLDNQDALRKDWPRIPLPVNSDDLVCSADLGRRLAALLDPETDVDGVTSGKIPTDLQNIAHLDWKGEGIPDERKGDFALKAHWGHRGQGGVVMPARGVTVWNNLPPDQPELDAKPLGPVTVDVKLNDNAWWTGIPTDVWEYTLGGYQVLKKWLSYREYDVLGRAMKAEEVREFSRIARRIYCILQMADELDESYRRCAANTWNPEKAE